MCPSGEVSIGGLCGRSELRVIEFVDEDGGKSKLPGENEFTSENRFGLVVSNGLIWIIGSSTG